MSRVTFALALTALLGCAATTTSTPNGSATTLGLAGGNNSNEIWVCHGNKKPKWKQVATPAADAHRRHGDRISYTHQQANSACTK